MFDFDIMFINDRVSSESLMLKTLIKRYGKIDFLKFYKAYSYTEVKRELDYGSIRYDGINGRTLLGIISDVLDLDSYRLTGSKPNDLYVEQCLQFITYINTQVTVDKKCSCEIFDEAVTLLDNANIIPELRVDKLSEMKSTMLKQLEEARSVNTVHVKCTHNFIDQIDTNFTEVFPNLSIYEKYKVFKFGIGRSNRRKQLDRGDYSREDKKKQLGGASR